MKRKLFILGAGASIEFGYPSGWQLIVDIIGNLASSNPHHRKIFSAWPELNELTPHFQTKLKYSDCYSIDAFLAQQRPLTQLGKHLIAYEIISHEDENRLFKKHPNNDHWYRNFFNELFKHTDPRIIPDNLINFITFNYDRSLEYYLDKKLEHMYGMSIKERGIFFQKTPIFHVYGSVDDIQLDPNHPVRQYSGHLDPQIVERSASRLKVIHEASEVDPETRKYFINQIEAADSIYIFGCGYHKENIELLSFPSAKIKGKKIFGTSKGLSPSLQGLAAGWFKEAHFQFAPNEGTIMDALRGFHVFDY